MPIIKTRKDERLNIEVQGTGPAVILLHGWCSSAQEWTKFIPVLSQSFTTYAVDARAHGKSEAPDLSECTLDRMADDLCDIIAHFKIENTMIIAHSMGAFMTWAYMDKYGQDKISKICFLDQTAKLVTDDTWDHGVYSDFCEQDNEQLVSDLHEDFAEGVLKLAAFGQNTKMHEKYTANDPIIQNARIGLSQLPAKQLIAIWESLTRSDFRPLVQSLTMPIFYVFGTESNFYGRTVAEQMHGMTPNSILHFYEGADHSPHLRQPERFCEEFNTFALQKN